MGRLVHRCQSGTEVNMAGGCVAPYGADMDRFRRELGEFRPTSGSGECGPVASSSEQGRAALVVRPTR